MIKYLFSDLDGTLFINEDVYRKDFKAIWKFVEAGGTFSIATGRTDTEIRNFIKEERFPQAKFRISANGSMVVAEDKELFTNPFPFTAQLFLKEYFEQHIEALDVLEISTDDFIYFSDYPEEWMLSYKDNAYEVNTTILERFAEKDFNILKLFVGGPEAFIDTLVSDIKQAYDHELDIFNDITEINLAAKNNNKGVGIQHILDTYQIKPEEIAVIGDGANDIDMFKITPNSFTFHHAKDFVQKEAAYIVENVAEAIDIIMKK